MYAVKVGFPRRCEGLWSPCYEPVCGCAALPLTCSPATIRPELPLYYGPPVSATDFSMQLTLASGPGCELSLHGGPCFGFSDTAPHVELHRGPELRLLTRLDNHSVFQDSGLHIYSPRNVNSPAFREAHLLRNHCA